MPDYVSIALQLVFLIAQLKRPGMMNEIRNAAFIATVGDDHNVPLIQHDVPAAPFRNVARIGREALRMGVKKDLEIGRAAEIDRRIRNLDRIGFWTLRNVGRNKRLKVVARLPARDGNHIGADAVLVIGIARRVIDALVVRAGLDVGEGSSEGVIVVGNAVGVGINRGSEVGGEAGLARPGGSLVPVDEAMRRCDAKAPHRDTGHDDNEQHARKHRDRGDEDALPTLSHIHFSPIPPLRLRPDVSAPSPQFRDSP